VSERYGHLSAAPQVRYRPQPTEELTAFVFFTAQQNGRIEVDASLADGAFHIRVQAPEHTDHIVLPAGSGAARIEKAGLVFQGEALWLRQRLDTELHIRCVGASRVECADVQLWHDGPKTGGELDARYADGRLTASAHEGQLAWSVLRKPGSRG
jgi:hypothetical protein